MDDRRRKLVYLKYGCFVVAIALVASLFYLSDFSEKAAQIVKGQLINGAKKICYQGHDAKGQPFTICAKEAQETSPPDILFHSVEIVLCLKTEHQVKLTANNALYHQDQKKMTLTGDVQLTHTNGLVLNTTEADVDLQNSTAENTVPVDGKGDKFTLKSNGFKVLDEGKRVIFLGNPEFKLHG